MSDCQHNVTATAADAAVRACIFDLDGTLLDSMPVWRSVDIAFLRKRGIDMPDDYPQSISALSIGEAAVYTINRFKLQEDADAICREWNSMVAGSYLNNIEMKPYAFEYLLAIKKLGLVMSVATSLSESIYTPVMKKYELTALFKAVCSTEALSKGKNHPDVFLEAAERMQVSPRECAVFDDLPEALNTAKSLGMRTVAVYDEATKSSWLQTKSAADDAIKDFASAIEATIRHQGSAQAPAKYLAIPGTALLANPDARVR